jgi:hypothetical protein
MDQCNTQIGRYAARRAAGRTLRTMKNLFYVILAIIAVMLVWGLIKWILAIALILVWKVVLIAAFVGLVYMVYKALTKQKATW